MKPWLNVNLEPLTCIITRGNSVKVAWSQTQLHSRMLTAAFSLNGILGHNIVR